MKKISILLPYKENFSPKYAGAVSLLVKDTSLKSKYKKKAWQDIDILIIDEVSMMSVKLFEILDDIGRRIRFLPSTFSQAY